MEMPDRSKFLRQWSIAAARGRISPPPKRLAIKRFQKDSRKSKRDSVNPLWGYASLTSTTHYDFPVIAFSIAAKTLKMKANNP
jgi:hypothetical protein